MVSVGGDGTGGNRGSRDSEWGSRLFASSDGNDPQKLCWLVTGRGFLLCGRGFPAWKRWVEVDWTGWSTFAFYFCKIAHT